MGTASFTILVVCTANRCRSPIAEAVVRRQLARMQWPEPWSVSSAGTMVPRETDMHPLARRVLDERGIGPSTWHTTQLNSSGIAEADLVLTAAAEHRRAVVSAYPKAVRRTFTIGRFAELATTVHRSASPGRTGDALINACLIAATRSAPGPDSRYDLHDPIGGDVGDFQDCANTIERAIGQIFAFAAAAEPVARENFPPVRPGETGDTAGRHRA